MNIVVKFLGVFKECAGQDRVALKLPDGATPASAYKAALKYLPSERRYPRVLFAVNQEYAKPNDRLRDGDELALIPPMSGG